MTLGKALIRNRFKENKNYKLNNDGLLVYNHSHLNQEESTNMKSITEQNDLSAFLTDAELQGRDFTAERLNITIVSQTATQVYYLTLVCYLMSPLINFNS
jgi:large subunit GTPase 1